MRISKFPLRILTAAVCFGLLMAVREYFSSIWLRALIAGIAFMILFGALGSFKAKGKLDKENK